MEFKTNLGEINIATEVIANIAGLAALECYGLVGMASKNQLTDGIFELLGWDNFKKGIIVNVGEEGTVVDVHVIVMYGVKISEVAQSVQNKIRHALKDHLDLEVTEVNVFVQGVKVIDEKKEDKK